jgi:hypothetical protein
MSLQVDLHFIVNGPDSQTNFGTQLLKLIMKADESNRAKLAKGFPNAVETVREWKATGVIPDLERD